MWRARMFQRIKSRRMLLLFFELNRVNETCCKAWYLVVKHVKISVFVCLIGSVFWADSLYFVCLFVCLEAHAVAYFLSYFFLVPFVNAECKRNEVSKMKELTLYRMKMSNNKRFSFWKVKFAFYMVQRIAGCIFFSSELIV